MRQEAGEKSDANVSDYESEVSFSRLSGGLSNWRIGSRGEHIVGDATKSI